MKRGESFSGFPYKLYTRDRSAPAGPFSTLTAIVDGEAVHVPEQASGGRTYLDLDETETNMAHPALTLSGDGAEALTIILETEAVTKEDLRSLLP